MLASGFASALISKALIFYVATTAVLVSATNTKPYFGFSIGHHLLKHGQWWRLLTWPLCYINSTEVLFAAVTLYQLRVVERLWGSRKFVSFLVATAPYAFLLPPLILACLRTLTLAHTFDHLPSGLTAILFALLAQYHAAVPYTYRYKLSATDSGSASAGVMLTSKSASYLPALQLALSQVPGSLVAAAVGWCVGYAWRMEVLPGAKWRVPSWVVGGKAGKGRQREVERLRRRMVAEGAGGGDGDADNVGGAGEASGVDAGREARRRWSGIGEREE